MNKYACRYAIVQFMPYPETGEFANVGVILAVPQKNIFTFRLETAKTARLTHFFNHLDRKIYLSAVKGLVEELKYYQTAVRNNQLKADTAFDNLVRPLETILRFSKERLKLVNGIEKVEDDLFERFVMHDFAKAPNYEGQLQQKIAQMVRAIDLEHKFKRKTLGPDTYKITMPLVQEKDENTRIIQPLYFNQDTPQAVIEHGNKWAGKLDTLRDFGALPDEILIPAKQPVKRNKEFTLAWDLVRKKLDHFGEIIKAADTGSIRGFAKN
ncbi:DUF3037 domain-containing protein [Endozoicomonas numazuensis]|uniref:DUF3037 domain-containing protein n=1 Tax=Endozoicomonas numazuensis TaxID=1137799 RepID=A0A081NED2_9GAMM|nr:DUF3037 domain-containing protein [Endozoicomonas numazuensis]KEQ16805.1 hypothetical protein GZ78_19215 [Endozoicomonas numazuensis]